MKGPFVIGGLVWFSSVAWGASPTISNQVDRWYWYSRELDEKALTEAEKREAIAEIRRRVLTGTEPRPGRSRWLLLILGDEETLAEVVKDIQKGERRKYLGGVLLLKYAWTPGQIPALAELLYLPEEARYRTAEERAWGAVTAPLEASWKIREILQAFGGSSPEMKKWANGLSQSDGETLRQTLRQWWEQNREAFLRKDYAAVKPLQPVSVSAPSAPPAATNTVPRTNRSPTPDAFPTRRRRKSHGSTNRGSGSLASQIRAGRWVFFSFRDRGSVLTWGR